MDAKWDTDAPITTDDIDDIAALIEAGPTGDDLLFEEWACTTIPRLIRCIRLLLS